MFVALGVSSFRPMNLVKIDIKPPKSRVVIKTTTRVELTKSPLFGEREGLI